MAQLVGASSRTPKDGRFHSLSGPTLGLWVRSLVGPSTEATSWCFSHIDVSLSLPLPLSKGKKKSVLSRSSVSCCTGGLSGHTHSKDHWLRILLLSLILKKNQPTVDDFVGCREKSFSCLIWFPCKISRGDLEFFRRACHQLSEISYSSFLVSHQVTHYQMVSRASWKLFWAGCCLFFLHSRCNSVMCFYFTSLLTNFSGLISITFYQ